VSDERSFLHDISSPFTSALLNLENAAALLEERKPENIEECLSLVKKSLAQVKRAAGMITARRESLINGGKS